MNPTMSDSSENNSTAEEERRLRELFREAEPPYLDDAGFTMRVVGRLPVSRTQRARRRLAFVGAATVLGSALAVPLAGPALAEVCGAGWSVVHEWSLYPVPLVGSAFTVGSLAVLLGSLAVGWWSYSRER